MSETPQASSGDPLASPAADVSPYGVTDLARRTADQEAQKIEAVISAVGLKMVRATVVAIDEENSQIRVRRATAGTEGLDDEPFYPIRGGAMPEVGDPVFGFENTGGPVFLGNLAVGGGGPPVGSTTGWGGTADPADTNWLICDGRAVSATTYPELLLVLGTTWNTGGETAGTFRIPDFRGRVAVGAGTGTGLTARAVAEKAGAETVALTLAQMPAHAHGGTTGDNTHDHGAATGDNTHSHSGVTGQDTHSHTGDSTVTWGVVGPNTALNSGGSFSVAVNVANTSVSTDTDPHTHTITGVTHDHTISSVTHNHTIASAGSGTAHENMQPWIGQHQIIRVA